MTNSAAASDTIGDAVASLGGAVQRQLGDALKALHESDLGLADAVVRGDAAINAARYAIEEQVTAELGSGSVQSDRLRFLIAVLNVVNDLERMGDHCEGIAKVALMLGHERSSALPESLPVLGDMVAAMLARGLAAFNSRDADEARLTCADDDAVDELYDTLYSELLAAMADDRDRVVSDTYLLWVTHNLERIADRVTNVCERTVYLVTGHIDELNVSNY